MYIIYLGNDLVCCSVEGRMSWYDLTNTATDLPFRTLSAGTLAFTHLCFHKCVCVCMFGGFNLDMNKCLILKYYIVNVIILENLHDIHCLLRHRQVGVFK
jgi:hypothetical protein